MGRGGGCPLCGAGGAACGHPSTSVPVDAFITEEVAAVGGQRRRYKVVMPSGIVATLNLNDADAERMGGVPAEESPGAAAATAVEEAPQPEPVAAPRPKRAPRNKARTPANKEGGGGG